MPSKHILHMVTPLKHMSPFDVNMAADAGFDVIATYTNVALDEVAGLVQDAIFSRPPDRGVDTGFFFAGKDAVLALDMLERARQAMVPPFRVSLFADPAGSFTTAAAMVAVVEQVLKSKRQKSLKGSRVAVFGATGVVGYCAAVLCALEGAAVTLVGYDGPERVAGSAAEIARRFGVAPGFADGSSEARKEAIIAQADVALCAGKAGVRILSKVQLAAARTLSVVADVNAVPPLGVEGLDLFARGAELVAGGVLGIGALAIGNVKYGTEQGLFKRMTSAAEPVELDFRDAFAYARGLAS